jgi:hypothetical protein
MKINIHTVFSNHSKDYYEYMIQNHSDKASDENELQFFGYCIDGSPKIKGCSEVYSLPKIASGVPTSDLHGHGLNHVLQNVMPENLGEEINVFADSDSVILMKNWDYVLVNLLKYNGIVGTTFERIGGFCSGDGKSQMYKNKPSITWMALSPNYDWSAMDLMPNMESTIKIETEEMSEIFELPVGYDLLRDTGWKLPIFLHENKIPFLGFDHVAPGDAHSIALKSCENYNEEYQVEGEPFLGHQRGSRKHKFRQTALSSKFYSACEAYSRKSFIMRYDLINHCIKKYGYTSYLEIGCQNNLCFDKIECEKKVGVDPQSGGTIKLTSDKYFAQNAIRARTEGQEQDLFDIVFIDGLHDCNQVVKDVNNAINYLNEGGRIILHDCNPKREEDQSNPNVRSGDAWKALAFFRSKHGLEIKTCDSDFGLGMIRFGENKNRLKIEKTFQDLTWNDLRINREDILNLVHPEEALEWF